MAYKNTYEDLLRDMEQNNIQFSDYDMALAEQNPDAGRSLYSQKVAYGKAATDEERTAANHAAEQIRQKYGGYTAGTDGTGFTLSDKYAPQPTPYTSQYMDQINGMLDQIMNREAFSYNPAADPSYHAYGEQYRNLGNKAIQNALGSAAAMTGGQLSSYAMTAAQQAQNDYNAQLSNAIPELQQLAYEMYLGEGSQMRQNLSTLMDLDATAYNRHQNEQADTLNNWQLNYGVDRDLISDQRYLEQLMHDRQTAQEQRDYERGVYADQRDYERGVYADQRDYERGVYADERDYERALDKAQLLGSAGNFSGYQALGFTDAEIQSLAKAYAEANVKSNNKVKTVKAEPAEVEETPDADEASPVELTGNAKELDSMLSLAARLGASVEEILDVVIGEQRRGKLSLSDSGRLFKKYTGK